MNFTFTNKILLYSGSLVLCFNLNAQKSETIKEEIIEIPDPIISDPDNEFYPIDSVGTIWGTDPFPEYGDYESLPSPDYYLGRERDADEPYTYVDVEAEYPGGFAQLMQFISENYNYPDVAQKNHIEGKLYVRFVVNEDGTVSDVSLDQKMVPSCPECDTEAIRVIRKLNGWTPGKIAGKPVRQWYIIPISLSL